MYKQELGDATEVLDTDAVEGPRRTDDPKPDDTVESETKKARPDRNQTARGLAAKINSAI